MRRGLIENACYEVAFFDELHNIRCHASEPQKFRGGAVITKVQMNIPATREALDMMNTPL
jgi:hypothetical protein